MSSPIERILPQDLPPDPNLVADLVNRLAGGEVLALPTETVYGLAARADSPDALGKIASLKGRPDSMPLTWHVAPSKIAVSLESYGESIRTPSLLNRLCDAYWPGPLTIILDGIPPGLEAIASGGATGIRCPAHPLTEAVLAAADFPVVMTSANRHGSSPALDADRVCAEFGSSDGLSLIVDGGGSQTGGASSILRLGAGKFELMREGLLSTADLRGAAGLRIGFTCTGNTCRSPMAEGLARSLIASALSGGPRLFPEAGPGSPAGRALASPSNFGFTCSSMGVAAYPGSPISQGSLVAAAEYGVDLSKHTARLATLEDIEQLDVIYGLTKSHVASLAHGLPSELGSRVQLLNPDGYDISDPIGGPIEVYRDTARQIAGCIEARLEQWV